MKQVGSDQRKAVGDRGELLAAAHLVKQQYTILAQKWRCRSGEIDIIAKSAEELVFVEVRTRSTSGTFGTPLESINYRKQAQVRKTAQIYLHRMNCLDARIRFDVIAIQLGRYGSVAELQHIVNAF